MITQAAAAPPRRRPGARVALTGVILIGPVPVLCFVALVGIAAAAGSGPRHTVTGPPATILMGLLVTGILSVVSGALLAVTGAVIFLMSRPRANAEAHARLRHARDTATTRAEAAALQRTIAPGRHWRRLLPIAPVAGPLGVAFLTSRVGLDTISHWALLAALPGALWIGERYSRRQRTIRAELRRQGLTGHSDTDDQPAIDRRAAAMATFAAERNLPYQPIPDALTPGAVLAGPASHLGRSGGCNQVRGTLNGTSFLVTDRIVHTETQVNNGPRRTRVAAADTTVAIPFPTVLALAVTPDTPEATLRWSYLGPQVQLESADFNAAYNVYCDDPVRARLVLNPAVMAVLLDWPRPLQLVLTDGELRLTTPNTLTATDRLDELIALAARIERSARAALV